MLLPPPKNIFALPSHHGMFSSCSPW